MKTLSELVTDWRNEADRIRHRYDDERLARLCEVHATELAERLRRHQDQKLTLQEAARRSGYSVSHLRYLIRDGEIPNAGRKGRPRIRRGDLPRKEPEDHGGSGDGQFDASQLAADVLDGLDGEGGGGP